MLGICGGTVLVIVCSSAVHPVCYSYDCIGLLCGLLLAW